MWWSALCSFDFHNLSQVVFVADRKLNYKVLSNSLSRNVVVAVNSFREFRRKLYSRRAKSRRTTWLTVGRVKFKRNRSDWLCRVHNSSCLLAGAGWSSWVTAVEADTERGARDSTRLLQPVSQSHPDLSATVTADRSSTGDRIICSLASAGTCRHGNRELLEGIV